MKILIVNSVEDYIDLAIDAVMIGDHRPNQFADLDNDQMSISDFFDTLPDHSELYEFFGIRNDSGIIKSSVYDNGSEWEEEEYPIQENEGGSIIKENLRIDYENYDLPLPKDFPIFLVCSWDDDRDRMGKISTRILDWVSVDKVQNSHSNGESIFKKTKRIWDEKFGKEYQEVLAYRESLRKNNS